MSEKFPQIKKSKEEELNHLSAVTEYFSGTMDSQAKLLAKKFFEDYLSQIRFKLVDYEENIIELRKFLESTSPFKRKSEHIEDIILELKNSGLISTPKKIFLEKTKKESPEFLETQYPKIGLTKGGLDIEKKQLEKNIEETTKTEIYLGSRKERLKKVYTTIEHKESESLEYYLAFEHLIKGGIDEIKSDFINLQEIKKSYKEKELLTTNQEEERLILANEIATITERGIEFAISELNWYGKEVRMKETSEHGDKKRGVDNLLEISKDGDKDFLGIATDVTFRKLESPEFEVKFFNLLDSIKKGYRTKLKYEKDFSEKPMREFSVPKILLHFEFKDIEMFLNMLEKRSTEDIDFIKEEFKNYPQKINYLEQIIYQCKILSKFAEKYENNVFKQYQTIIDSVKILSWNNKEIKKAMQTNESNNVAKKLGQLVEQFENMTNR